MVKPKVSIVVPNYNHGRFLRERLCSILRQACHDFEVFVLDDTSTDHCAELLQELLKESHPPSRIQFVLEDKNSDSVFKQWNRGIALARGEYAWIAESNDYADPSYRMRADWL
jgi:glycosyltransferase involved in cell wall biosynthesis